MISYIDNPIFRTDMVSLALIMMLGISPILFLYTYPILILRNRIRDEKQKELNVVFHSLQGNDDSIKAINIQGRGVPSNTTDLLTHRMFLESRWEWPIAFHASF